MAEDFEFEVESIGFRVKRTNRCKIIYVGVDPHCRQSDRQTVWIHNSHLWARFYDEPPAFVQLLVCTCRRCPHPRPDMETISEDFRATGEFVRYLERRQRRLDEIVLRGDRRQITAAKETSLDICRRIAAEGYTEDIAYEIMELVHGLPVGEGE